MIYRIIYIKNLNIMKYKIAVFKRKSVALCEFWNMSYIIKTNYWFFDYEINQNFLYEINNFDINDYKLKVIIN